MTEQAHLLKRIKREVIVNGETFIKPDFIETNSALIVFVGDKAFKILKEDRPGLDCSTILTRCFLLEEEFESNSEISNDLYLSINPISLFQGQVVIHKTGKKHVPTTLMEYALCMKKLRQDSLVYRMLLNKTYSCRYSILIARKIASFHKAKLLEDSTENDQRLIAEFGTIKALENIVEKDFQMFEKLKIDFIPTITTKRKYQKIKRYILDFLKRKRNLMIERTILNYILPIHGDFHAQNIFVEEGVVHVIDRSLRRNMRVSDIVKDLAYLGVDLEMFGFEKEKYIFFKEYHFVIEDPFFEELLPFYMCRRAFVAGMVNLHEKNIEDLKAYFDLAYKYAINLQ